MIVRVSQKCRGEKDAIYTDSKLNGNRLIIHYTLVYYNIMCVFYGVSKTFAYHNIAAIILIIHILYSFARRHGY